MKLLKVEMNKQIKKGLFHPILKYSLTCSHYRAAKRNGKNTVSCSRIVNARVRGRHGSTTGREGHTRRIGIDNQNVIEILQKIAKF